MAYHRHRRHYLHAEESSESESSSSCSSSSESESDSDSESESDRGSEIESEEEKKEEQHRSCTPWERSWQSHPAYSAYFQKERAGGAAYYFQSCGKGVYFKEHYLAQALAEKDHMAPSSYRFKHKEKEDSCYAYKLELEKAREDVWAVPKPTAMTPSTEVPPLPTMKETLL